MIYLLIEWNKLTLNFNCDESIKFDNLEDIAGNNIKYELNLL